MNLTVLKRSILLFLITYSLFSQKLLTPDEFLGYELGTRFTPHHKVVAYFKSVQKARPDQVQLTKYGTTNEGRALYLAFLTSPENIRNIEQIRQKHLVNAGIREGDVEASDVAIVWLSYNVHGNEASATESSMKTLYKLLSENPQWLKNTLVIIDPCINPDGRDRYVNWYTQTSRFPFDSDPQAREHKEPWPNGRPNHYLFDLNRDWMWATQIETQYRLKQYNKWMPHIHVDFHEQGINDNYYFAPAAKPFHEIISPWQREFQTQIGKNHAKYFDEKGWLFFTRERFDLFYPSYGDTYPTYMGAIGMTYEQAGNGSAGLGIMTKEKEILSLKDRLEHHTMTGLSTVEIASTNAVKLNEEFKNYFQTASLPIKSYVLSGNDEKLQRLTALLDRHEISYERSSKASVSGYDYASGSSSKVTVDDSSLVIHTTQPKGKMVKALFEPKANLEDSLTYDITAWALPYAYGLQAVASKRIVDSRKIESTFSSSAPLSRAFGYVCEWNSMADAKFLSVLLQKGIKVRYTDKPFNSNGSSYKPGALLITLRDNLKVENFVETLAQLAESHQLQLKPIQSGYSEKTPDIGSQDIKFLHSPKVAVFAGRGISSLSYGEVWHYFEKELAYPVTSLNLSEYKSLDLSPYDVIVLPNGNYKSMVKSDSLVKLKEWVKEGGRVVGIQSALDVFAENKDFKLKKKKKDSVSQKKDIEKDRLVPYANREREGISNLITGAIFKSQLDDTHPLAFGYDNTYFTLKLSSSAYSLLDKGFNVAYLVDDKVYSGFAGHKAKRNIQNSLVFGEERIGKGSMVYLVDNVLFRAFWENGKLFMANAVFFVNNDGD